MSEVDGSVETEVLHGVAPADVRVRFPPSPTGNLHVGNVRSALFNWAFARHFGGTFVLRIEDTDAARNTEDGLQGVLDSLSWLGLDWDEGPDIGGPHAPYVQSERAEAHADIVARLLEGGFAYRCFCTREEIEAREALRPQGTPSGYDGFCRSLTEDDISAKRAAGVPFVVRVRVPDEEIVFDDLVRGRVSFSPEHVPDYVIVRSSGDPLYTLVNPVDDALMAITHVLRGEDLLSSTPRQIVLYQALAQLGVGNGRVPVFGHLPTVLGEGNRRLSKRDKGAGLQEYRERGFLPVGLLNYLALLGWSIAEDRDVFTMAEMVAAFDIRRVNANPARFDLKKCEAINADHIRLLSVDELADRLLPFLQTDGVVADPAPADQVELLRAAAPLVAERITTLSEVTAMLGFLFQADDTVVVDDNAGLNADSDVTLAAAATALADVEPFEHAEIEAALRASLVEGLGLKPKFAFGPVRAAVTGHRISPPLFESLELLGRASSLARIERARAGLAQG